MWRYAEIRYLPDIPRYWAGQSADKVALIEGSARRTYSQLDERSSAIANRLLEMGVRRGDTIGYIGKNSIEVFEVWFAASKIGCTFAPFNWRLAVAELVGILDDVHKTAKMHFDAPRRTIVLLRAGEAADITDVESEFGSSEYAKEILGALWGYPPELDLEREAALQKAVIELIQERLVESVHDCSDGGLAVALAEKAFPKGVGAQVNLAANGLPAEFVLFGEDASRILLSCDAGQVARIKEVAQQRGVFAEVIGETVPGRLEITVDGRSLVSAMVSELSAAYEDALEAALRTDAEMVETG